MPNFNNNYYPNDRYQNNGRSNDRRYDNRGYDNRGGNYGGYGRNNYQQNDTPFQLGDIVRHVGTGTKLIVINFGREQIECRTPDLRSEYFYIHELEPWDDSQQQ